LLLARDNIKTTHLPETTLINTEIMRTRTLFLVLPSLVSAHAIKLLVASYKPENGTLGALQTLAFKHHNASLHVTHTNHDCGALPSWLDVSPDGSTVTCVNEADPGSLTTFDVQCGGSLEVVSNTSTPGGPVSNVYFGNGSAVAVAHVSR
jgi:6-phosphogluconolactonase (cycloisomerase 2 family)